MLSSIRNSILTKFIWGLMGLHLLNISVDIADRNPESFPEDLSFNDQESIIEIVLEKILCFEDALHEYDDHDTDDQSKKSTFKLDLITSFVPANDLNASFIKTTKQHFPEYNPFINKGFQNLTFPPPKI